MNKWTLNVYVKDARRKAGERLAESFDYEGVTEQGIQALVSNMTALYPAPKHRIEYHPKTKIVKNLMSGKDVEIAYNTPRCCDPSSELYWTM